MYLKTPQTMEQRINISQSNAEAVKGLLALEKFTSPLSATHKELIKMRTSQLNGCAFCIDMHTKDARKNGETEQRIYLLNAWKETNLYTEEERAILALTEEVTLIHQGGVSDATYAKAHQLFDDQYLTQLIIAIVAINGWNRIAITTQLQPASN